MVNLDFYLDTRMLIVTPLGEMVHILSFDKDMVDWCKKNSTHLNWK